MQPVIVRVQYTFKKHDAKGMFEPVSKPGSEAKLPNMHGNAVVSK